MELTLPIIVEIRITKIKDKPDKEMARFLVQNKPVLTMQIDNNRHYDSALLKELVKRWIIKEPALTSRIARLADAGRLGSSSQFHDYIRGAFRYTHILYELPAPIPVATGRYISQPKPPVPSVKPGS